jgi:hypothetical protein
MSRNQDLQRISELISGGSTPTHHRGSGAGKGFAIGCLVLVIIFAAIVGYIYYKNFYISDKVYVKEIPKVEALKPEIVNEYDRVYYLVVVRGVWCDTSIWVKPGQTVYVRTTDPHEPFEISLGSQKDSATIAKQNWFSAQIINEKRQEKLYLKASEGRVQVLDLLVLLTN